MTRQRFVKVREAGQTIDLANPGTAQRIVDAAMELFFERGYPSTTMRDIAEACGITVGALYNHFLSKDQLLYTIIKRVHDDLEHDLVAALGQAGEDPRDRLAALARTHAIVHTRYRKDARVANAGIFSLLEPGRNEIIEARRRMRAMFEEVISDGVERGVFHVADLKVVAMAILNSGIQISTWFRPGDRLSAEQVAEIQADLALRMVGGHRT